MSYETILTELVDRVLLITLNRPERLNAWTKQMSGELQRAITEGNEDQEVEAFVFTGAGRGFCAGADIKDVFQKESENPKERREGASGGWVEMIRQSKPIVAAVNGAAIGVGLTQILPMDFIVASTAAKFSCRFVKMGLVPELASSHFIVARCGFGQASELMLSGRTIDATEAGTLGLVDRVVAPEALISEAMNVARSMGENPQSALAMVKELITQNMVETNLELVQQRELAALSKCYVSPEHKEAIQAFLEKREPDFKGIGAK